MPILIFRIGIKTKIVSWLVFLKWWASEGDNPYVGTSVLDFLKHFR